MAKRPDKNELATMEALSQSGNSPYAIGKIINRDDATVRKYLNADLHRDDPEFNQLVKTIKDLELKDCNLLVAKARTKLHDMLDNDEMKPIEVIATADRFFQQGQLLSGGATSNVNVNVLHETSEQRQQKIRDLEDSLKE